MCIAFVLMLNAFYKIYYGLFDLCEQFIALVSLICILCFFSFILFFNYGRPGAQTSLIAISVLGIGVFGGLLVVISVIHVYRLLLKRRLPITTTNRPHQKRAHIRNLDPSRWKPLLLPNTKPYSNKTNLNRHVSFGWESCSTGDRILDSIPEEWIFIDETSDTCKFVNLLDSPPDYGGINRDDVFIKNYARFG